MRTSPLPIATFASAWVALLVHAVPATAACSTWNVPAGYTLNQNNGYKVKLLTGLSGKAQYWPATTRTPIVNGDVFAGLVTATKISFKIRWQNGAVGAYDGDVTPNGYVRGSSRDERSGDTTTFVGAILKCAAEESAGPQSKPDATVNQRIEARCRSYAETAMHAVGENKRLRCGSTGGRWSDSYGHHYGWCMGLAESDRRFMQSEAAARDAALKVCATAAGSGIKRAPSDVIRKPGRVVR